MHYDRSSTCVYVQKKTFYKARKGLFFLDSGMSLRLSGLACGVYQKRNLWVCASGRHSTESYCEVNKWVIHLCICAHSCPPYSYVPPLHPLVD